MSFQGTWDHTSQSLLASVFPLLLAVTDDELATSAIRVTSALAQSKGAVPTVVQAVGERVAEVAPSPFIGAVLDESLSPEYRDDLRDALRKRITATAGIVPWRLEIAHQRPADAIPDMARQIKAELIVMGLGHHGPLHGGSLRGLVRTVVRTAGFPVLAVRPQLSGVPRRIVVGSGSARAGGGSSLCAFSTTA